MIFSSKVRRVQITYSDGTTATIPAHEFSADQSRSGGLAGFRYAAFSVHGPWCPERLVSQSGSGRTLWDGTVEKPLC